jgi:hypothetical protein
MDTSSIPCRSLLLIVVFVRAAVQLDALQLLAVTLVHYTGADADQLAQATLHACYHHWCGLHDTVDVQQAPKLCTTSDTPHMCQILLLMLLQNSLSPPSQ